MSGPTKLVDLTVDTGLKSRAAVIMSDEPDYLGLILPNEAGCIYDLRRQAEDGLIKLPIAIPFTGLAFRPKNGNHGLTEVAIATGYLSEHVQRFDLQTGVALKPLAMGNAHCLAYSYDGSLLAAGSTDGRVRVWRLENGQEIFSGKVGDGCVTALALSGTRDCLYACLSTGTVYYLPIGKKSESKFLLADPDNKKKQYDWDCYCLATHPHANLVALGGYGNDVFLVNMRNLAVKLIQTSVGAYVRCLHFLADQQQLLIVGESGVEVWNLVPTFEKVELERVNIAPGKALTACLVGNMIICVRG